MGDQEKEEGQTRREGAVPGKLASRDGIAGNFEYILIQSKLLIGGAG